MKILLDANLSWRLAKELSQVFESCLHVDYCKLSAPAKDSEIWNLAKENDYLIITNDLDFMHLSNMFGFPPKCIILRTGNQSTDFLFRLIKANITHIKQFADSDSEGILEIYS